jgi:hypothetical protein
MEERTHSFISLEDILEKSLNDKSTNKTILIKIFKNFFTKLLNLASPMSSCM